MNNLILELLDKLGRRVELIRKEVIKRSPIDKFDIQIYDEINDHSYFMFCRKEKEATYLYRYNEEGLIEPFMCYDLTLRQIELFLSDITVKIIEGYNHNGPIIIDEFCI